MLQEFGEKGLRDAGAEVNKISTGSKEEGSLEYETDRRAEQVEARTIWLFLIEN